jgi:SAM-dependent methyltransferase
MAQPPLLFDRALHARRLARAAGGFSAADFLKRRAADDIVERLETINRRFDVAADLGARGGVFARALAQSPAAARVGLLISADLSPAMAKAAGGVAVAADEERLPFAFGALNLAVSSLALHWTNDLIGALVQIRLALAPDGLFVGAMLAGGTLAELRACLLEAEVEARGGAGPRLAPLPDAADGGALLQRAGFALPVADTDTVTVRYTHPLRLLADLRAMGETNALIERPRRPLSRAILARAFELYQARFADDDGRVRATFEILTLTGWAPHAGQPQPLRPGSAKARLADALGVVERKAGDRAAP